MKEKRKRQHSLAFNPLTKCGICKKPTGRSLNFRHCIPSLCRNPGQIEQQWTDRGLPRKNR
jgi:hypothetical protein